MIIDIILACLVLVWAIYGYRKGLVRQIFVLIGISLIVFASAPLADIVENILKHEFNIPIEAKYMRGILLTVCGSFLYALSYILGRFLHDTLVKGITVAEKTNHIFGAALGIIESMLVVYFILGIGAIYENKIQEYAPGVHQVMTESTGYHVAQKNNIMENFNFFKPKQPSAEETQPSPQEIPAPDKQNEQGATKQPETPNPAPETPNPAPETPNPAPEMRQLARPRVATN